MSRLPIASRELRERALQAECIRWWNQADLPGLLFHVPNEGKRTRIDAASLRALGVVAGAPDFVLLLPQGRVHLIELKVPGGEQSGAQVTFEDDARRCGHTYSVVTSAHEFFADVLMAMRWWLGPDGYAQNSLLEIGQTIPLP